MVTESPSSYLVLASQRSGSTLLVESLRATGVAGEPQEFFQYLPTTSQSPQPREWFTGVEDKSILDLLDPLDEGKPDLAPAEIWRDYIRTVGRTPNGIWGGKLMWNQTPLLLQRAGGLPDRSGPGLLSAIRDVVGEVICEVEDTSAFVQNEEQLAANARLIAAAPDLLTALKAFVDKHDGERWLLGPQLERYLPAMRAALTKAKGPQ